MLLGLGDVVLRRVDAPGGHGLLSGQLDLLVVHVRAAPGVALRPELLAKLVELHAQQLLALFRVRVEPNRSLGLLGSDGILGRLVLGLRRVLRLLRLDEGIRRLADISAQPLHLPAHLLAFGASAHLGASEILPTDQSQLRHVILPPG